MKTHMSVFMLIMFIVGLVLTIFAFRLSTDIKDCTPVVQNATQGLLVLGVMIITVAVTSMVCGCGSGSEQSTGTGYVLFMLALGITIMVLTSIIHNGCQDARTSTPILITLSVLITVISGFILFYKSYKSEKEAVPAASF